MNTLIKSVPVNLVSNTVFFLFKYLTKCKFNNTTVQQRDAWPVEMGMTMEKQMTEVGGICQLVLCRLHPDQGTKRRTNEENTSQGMMGL